jgi:hypothetical protein
MRHGLREWITCKNNLSNEKYRRRDENYGRQDENYRIGDENYI